MTDKQKDDARLATLFEAARDTSPAPGDDLLARVMQDADRVQGGFAPVTAPARRAPVSGLTRLSRMLGGWPAMAGLTAAMLAGIWIGISPPAGLARVTMAALGGQSYVIDADPVSMFDFTQEAL